MKIRHTIIILVLVVSAILLGYRFGFDDGRVTVFESFYSPSGSQLSTTGNGATAGVTVNTQLAGCPDDGDTSLKLNVYNVLNTSGTENFDITYYILGADGGVVTSVADTTSPDAVTVDCGYEYTLVAVATDGAGGDHSTFEAVTAKPVGSDARTDGGNIVFTADRSNMNLKANMEQHGTLQFKVYDNEDARFAFDTGDSASTTWELTGTTYTDGDNSTAFAVGVDGYLDLTVKMQGVQADTDPMDMYTYVAFEADVAKWNEPSVKYNGKTLRDISDDLSGDEGKALSSYEYVYKITDDIENDIQEFDVYMETCGGCNPTADVEIDLFGAGNFLATDGTTVKTGSHKDDSGRSTVFTKQEITIDVS